MFILQEYEANKNLQKTVNFTKSSIVDTDYLGNISYIKRLRLRAYTI